jgi:hypothetical protein
MKVWTIFIFIGMLLFLLLVYSVDSIGRKYEGFDNSTQANYEALQARLKTTMTPYCKLATYVQAQMKTIYMAAKPSESSGATTPGDTSEQADAHIQQTYKDVYACKDELASSRLSCKGLSISNIKNSDSTPGFISCDNYLNLPNWPDQDGAAAALNNIPDDLADRIGKELDWYSLIIKKLTDAFDAGNSPPSVAPDSPNSPATDSSGKEWTTDSKKEGFFGGKCSPAAAQAKLALLKKQQLQDAAESCSLPNIDSEIARVNALLDSDTLKTAISKSAAIQSSMASLQAIQAKAANGTLFPWQQDGPKKSYKAFGGGDRTQALIFSMKQNT